MQVGFTLSQATKALRESRGIAVLYFRLEGGEGSVSRPGNTLPPGKTRYPFYMRLGGHQSRSGLVRKISPHRDSIPGQSIPQAVAIPTTLPGPQKHNVTLDLINLLTSQLRTQFSSLLYFGHRLKIYCCKICVFRRKGLAGENNVTNSRKNKGKKTKQPLFEGDTSLAS